MSETITNKPNNAVIYQLVITQRNYPANRRHHIICSFGNNQVCILEARP